VALYRIWETFNVPDNALRKKGMAPHESAMVINTLAQAAINETVLILARALDHHGRGDVLSSDRVSFPVILELSKQPGVEDELIERRRSFALSDSDFAISLDGYHAAKRAFHGWFEGLDQGKHEHARRVRDFRNDYLAHNLNRGIEPTTLKYEDIARILPEMMLLCDQANLAFANTSIIFDAYIESVSARAHSLWRMIAIGVDTDRFGSPSPDLLR
jgi:hypothetical protein